MDGIARIEAVDSPAVVHQQAGSGAYAFPSDIEPVRAPEKRAPQNQAVELLLSSASPSPGGLPAQSYARIRYDEQSRTVCVQIINAESDEVIREIPPGAWQRLNQGMPLPTGLLVERAQ